MLSRLPVGIELHVPPKRREETIVSRGSPDRPLRGRCVRHGCFLGAGARSRAEIDADLFAGLKARSIGPAGMSGRVASIDAVIADPDVIWVGAATGGVWKSTNGGRTWDPVFDDQPVAAIGAVSIFQSSPDVVWVGTGEGNPRNSVSVGNGIYRTLDGGQTWQHLGLEGTERIHRVILDARDPDRATVCAMGREWGENDERGIFRTTDGGKSWNKILYVDERTGCADLKVRLRFPERRHDVEEGRQGPAGG